MLSKTKAALLVPVVTVGLMLLGPTAAFAVTSPAPDPGALAEQVANDTGGSMLSAIVAVLPKVVPILIAFWAIGFVWNKVKPKKGGIH
jgi:H+/gluconate symporter-like permease